MAASPTRYEITPPNRRNIHAHPSEKAFDDSIRQFLVDFNVDLELRGLPGENRFKVTDLYCPEIRRSPFTSGKPVSHLDVVTCWKGLSFDQASEVARWELLFRRALEDQLLDTMLLKHLLLHGEPLKASTLVKDISVMRIQSLEVNIARLVHNMTRLCYAEHGSAALHRGWFSSTGSLPTMLYNFVRTRDCFLDSSPLPRVELSFSCTHFGSELHIFGDVSWQLPMITFPFLPAQIQLGSEYAIAPHYVSPDLGSSSGSNFAEYPESTEFKVSSGTLDLEWDAMRQAFYTFVPHDYAQEAARTSPHEGSQRMQGSTRARDLLLDLYGVSRKNMCVETTLTAKIVLLFPGDVRFERVSRYCIKLDISEPGTSSRFIKMPSSPEPSWATLFSNIALSKRERKAISDFKPASCKPASCDTLPELSSTERRVKMVGEGKCASAKVHSPQIMTQDEETLKAPHVSDLEGHESPSPACGQLISLDDPNESPFLSSPELFRRSTANAGRLTKATDVLQSTALPREQVLQKRKASKQVPLSCMFDQSSVPKGTRLALDQFEHLDLELTAKRQRVDQRIDSSLSIFSHDTSADEVDAYEDWPDEQLSGLGAFTTRCLGKALTSASTRPSTWSKKLSENYEPLVSRRSRAYEANHAESKVMPSLKKKGSVKRMIFPQRKRSNSLYDSPSPENTTSHISQASEPSLSQGEIQSNYQEFLTNSQGKAAGRKPDLDGAKSEDDERTAFEKIFLGDSPAEDWSTEAEDLSADLEVMSLGAGAD